MISRNLCEHSTDSKYCKSMSVGASGSWLVAFPENPLSCFRTLTAFCYNNVFCIGMASMTIEVKSLENGRAKPWHKTCWHVQNMPSLDIFAFYDSILWEKSWIEIPSVVLYSSKNYVTKLTKLLVQLCCFGQGTYNATRKNKYLDLSSVQQAESYSIREGRSSALSFNLFWPS